MKDIIIVCEDLFGMEVASLLEDINRWFAARDQEELFHILGYLSDSECPFGSVKTDLAHLGTIRDWSPLGEERYVMGMLLPASKRYAVETLVQRGCRFTTIYTPWMLAPEIDLGLGSIVAAYSVKQGIKLGRYATIMEGMITSHHIGEYSTILRFSNITGDVENDVYIGNHVYSHTGTVIGDHAFVADGSIVVKNVKPGTSVSGIPAKRIKKTGE